MRLNMASIYTNIYKSNECVSIITNGYNHVEMRDVLK